MKNLAVNTIVHEQINENRVGICCLIDGNVCFYQNCGTLSIANDAFTANVRNVLTNAESCNVQKDPIYLGYSGVSNKVVVAFSTGDIVSVVYPGDSPSHEGTIEPGLLVGCLSPGEDLLAFVSTQQSLIVLDTEFDIVFEIDLLGEGLEQPITVGWGTKETQFRGTEGKLSTKIASVPDTGIVKDDGKVRLSWRGDGEYLAASILVDGQRFIKVISKDGQLVHSSEVILGLESALSWRPNGSLISSSQQLPNKHVICFFEKNTLPHGQFHLENQWAVRELLWSCDSSVLAAILDGAETQIRLFTSSNYHWYHKFSITIDKGETLVSAIWDPSDALLLHVVVSSEGSLRHTRYSWRWTVDSSSGISCNDEAFVAVIDGSRILMTCFRRGIVPPPMSSHIIECSKPINAVGFIQAGAVANEASSNDMFAFLNDSTLVIYKYNEEKGKHDLASEYFLNDRDIFQISWVSNDIIMGCRAYTNGRHDLWVMKIPQNAIEHIGVPQPLTVIRRRMGEPSVLLCSSALYFSSYHLNQAAIEEPTPSDVPICKGKILAAEMKGIPIMLDSSSSLHVASQMVSKDITSIHLYDDMLLATTLRHKLLCIPLAKLSAVTERAVEPGARLVTVIPGTGKVVLQMPRGNLEVVQPRALALRTLKDLLDEFKYGEAFAIMRRERINLNLLCDHNLEHFVEHIGQFLDAVRDPVALCTFIAELVAENVSKTMYSSFYLDASLGEYVDKVNRICNLTISAIEKRVDAERYFLVVLSCFVKKGDPGSALLRIKVSLDAERKGMKPYIPGAEGLRHVMYLIDIEQLFKVALGTYDLDLVKYVASKSQKDPKEYIPFLSNLREMEINYRKFTIDKFLKRYDSALKALVTCPGKLAECLELIESQKLYQKALMLFEPESDGYKAVCLKYGEELLKQKKHDEGGIILLKGGHTRLALFAFTRSGNWCQVLHCAHSLNYSAEELKDLSWHLADSLKNEKRYEDAAKLLLEYTDDFTGAIESLCNAQLFEEALRICRLRRKEEIIQLVKTSAVSAAESLTANLRNFLSSFQQQADRLKAVREKKQDEAEVDWDDLQSESSRGSSQGSRSTARSAKNSRKLERKLLSLKEGGAFEDLALIASLHDNVSQTVSKIPQIRSINMFLLLVNETATASTLQYALKNYLNLISKRISEVWRPIGCSDEQGANATSNSIAASWANRTQTMPLPIQAIQPKLLFAPNLSTSIQWEFGILQSDVAK